MLCNKAIILDCVIAYQVRPDEAKIATGRYWSEAGSQLEVFGQILGCYSVMFIDWLSVSLLA